ncbi:phosphoglycerate mutase-like protein [Parathielavia appendiculata]|uniref:Phosphoglycerate mutase-like protein n=1 Tax=Parathielavia appendiculata TaxID=2587402 RepID=A0AAN6TRA6_9PEZI|nr:phosphoglycerate mutase-like protein [Parathielavia appendiculata]
MPPTLILVRHAQALHNVDKDYTLHDPELSELGRKQCAELKEQLIPRIPKNLDVGLIIVSPMKRTLETALLAFGELIDRGIPIVAHAGWQETSAKPCDVGSPLASLPPLFPQVDFSHVDPVFPDKTSPAGAFYRYSRQAVVHRGQTVLRELRDRPEKAVIVVSHSGFLKHAVTGHFYMNADYRIFDFVDGHGDGALNGNDAVLRQWEETKKGGMGWSWEETVPLGDGLPDDDDFAVDAITVDAGDGDGSVNDVQVHT